MRPSGWRSRTSRCPVIPLPRSGLHCGASPAARLPGWGSCHPAPKERAPLRRISHPSSCGGASMRHPAPKERAPLRPAPRGLAASADPDPVIPLPRSGLHCGTTTLVALTSHGRCHPAPKERAPLRQATRSLDRDGVFKSSRSQGAGSIAAASWTGTAHDGSWASSRSQGAGSIAARSS